MKNSHTLFSTLVLGAAILATPVLAQDVAPTPGPNTAPATAVEAQDNASTPALPIARTAGNPDAQMANSGGSDTIADNSHRFRRSRLNSDNQSEDQTTRDLNQHESHQ